MARIGRKGGERRGKVTRPQEEETGEPTSGD